MKNLILIIVLILSNIFVTVAQEDSFLGIWEAPDNDSSTIEIFKGDDGIIQAKIIASAKAEHVGLIILKEGSYQGEKNEIKATLVRPGTDKTIGATLSVVDEKTIKVVGKKFLFKKSFIWIRE